MCLGEWLNGRVAVSKTVGCVFESRLPCHRFPTTVFVVGFSFCFEPSNFLNFPAERYQTPEEAHSCQIFAFFYDLYYFSVNA